MKQGPTTTRHVTKRGTISYKIDNPEFPNGDWGREFFIMTRHANGDRVLRAYCELNDEPALIRDIIQRVDAEFHPQDAVIRLTEADAFKGSSWYRFTDEKAEMQGVNAKGDRVSGEIEIDRSIRGFVNHSLAGDGWLMASVDLSKGRVQQSFYDNPLSSLDHRGATGPALETSKESKIAYIGEETITVPAGTFDCHHFAFVIMTKNHPPYHLWTTSDGDFVFVKGTVDAPYGWTFELTEFQES